MANAKFELVLRMVNNKDEMLAETVRTVIPEWELSTPARSAMQLLAMTDYELKEHMASRIIEALKSSVAPAVVELLFKIEELRSARVEDLSDK